MEPKSRPKTGEDVVYTMKSNGIAAVLSFLVPGLGQVYNGQLTRGLLLILVAIVVLAVGWILLFPVVLYIVLWVWSIYDAYSKANVYNASVKETGNPPW